MSNQTGTATSRAREVRDAVRKPSKARLMLSGASGSGKTWTALDIATVLAPGGRILVIDTEPSDDANSAAELYADQFRFRVIDWRAPALYDPRDLALTMRDLGDAPDRPDVLIIDSASAFWRGPGGTLDIAHGRYQGWSTATPAQEDLVAAILAAPFHVILCTRARQDYAIETGDDNKQNVKKLGMAPVQRDDLEYELQVVVQMDSEHRMEIGKTRCADLGGKSYPANEQRQFAEVYRSWLARGVTVLRMAEVEIIQEAFARVLDERARITIKREFVAEFGRPETLDVEQLDAVWAWLAERLAVPVHRYIDDGDGAYRCTGCGLSPAAGWHNDDADLWDGTTPAPPAADADSPFPEPEPPAPQPAPEPEPPAPAPEPAAPPPAASTRRRR